ncbi:MAG: hypothetical protein MUF64_04280 [Polyangiaceae bacterium]|nr:hypothetical protein [Polyangiaceae bacterium]
MARTPMPDWAIWLFALGYLGGYAPYSALTKLLSKGSVASFGPAVPGLSLLPLSSVASVVCAVGLLLATGWWRQATRHTVGGVTFHGPGRYTLLSGLCSSAIILTTTLAYTFEGISIVFMMLLLRGGVLLIAPAVDLVSGRKVRWFSWVALGLSLGALLLALDPRAGFKLSPAAIVDVVIYLLAYFVRLRLMSKLAKGSDEDNLRYFAEEQMVSSPAALAALGVLALGSGPVAMELRRGFTEVPFGPAALAVVLVGVLSQSNGVFGGLVLLDKRENSFAVPVNRASSILAGLLATLVLWGFFGEKAPGARELVGATFILVAVLFLSFGPRWSKAAG